MALIEDELDEDPSGAPSSSPHAVAEDASEPLSLEPEVDAAVAHALGSASGPKLVDEISEIEFLRKQGFLAKAQEGWQTLWARHRGHEALAALGQVLGMDVAGTGGATVVTRTPKPDLAGPIETPTSPTFVEGSAPPPGGFAASSAVPLEVEPRVTPALGIESTRRNHAPSSESLPTNPRMAFPPAQEGTVVAAPGGVKLVMLGARGQAVWDRVLPPGVSIEIGRDPAQPWGDDPNLRPQHARLHALAGGGLRVEPLGEGSVFRKLDERLAVRDGDEFRVGESVLRYSSAESGWGTLTWSPLSPGGSHALTHALVLGDEGALVGRENAEIELPEDTFVSGAHCQFSCREEGVFVEDLGSANGTYARVRDDEAVPRGSVILLGQTQFAVHPG